MLHVTLIHVRSDFHTASASSRPPLPDVVSPEQLTEVLERFRQREPQHNANTEPQLVIVSPAGKHVVRTVDGKLFLYDARDASAPSRELTAVGIREALSAPERLVNTTAPADEALLEPVARRSPAQRRTLALALIAGCVLLNAYTFVSATRHEELNGRPPVQFLTDAAELNARRQSAAGHYATGSVPGDRRIEIRADGRIRFARVVSAGERFLGEDSYRIGRSESGTVCLVTPHHGVVELRSIDTVVYYRDTYRRQP